MLRLAGEGTLKWGEATVRGHVGMDFHGGCPSRSVRTIPERTSPCQMLACQDGGTSSCPAGSPGGQRVQKHGQRLTLWIQRAVLSGTPCVGAARAPQKSEELPSEQ